MNLNDLIDDGYVSPSFENDDQDIHDITEVEPLDELALECMVAEYCATERRMVRLGELFKETTLSQSISRGIAMEALEIYPDFDPKGGPNYYTEHPTQTRYKVAVENFTKGQMVLGAGLAALVIGIIWRVLKWLFTGENTAPPANVSARDVSKLISTEQVPAEKAADAMAESAENADKRANVIEDDMKEVVKMKGSVTVAGKRVEIHSQSDLDKAFMEALEKDNLVPSDERLRGAFVRAVLHGGEYVNTCIDIFTKVRSMSEEIETALRGVQHDLHKLASPIDSQTPGSADVNNDIRRKHKLNMESNETVNSVYASKLQMSITVGGKKLTGREITDYLREQHAVESAKNIPTYKTCHGIINDFSKKFYSHKIQQQVTTYGAGLDALVERLEKITREIENTNDLVDTQAHKGELVKHGNHMTVETTSLFRDVINALKEQARIMQDAILYIRNEMYDYGRCLRFTLDIQYCWIVMRTTGKEGEGNEGMEFLKAIEATTLKTDHKNANIERNKIFTSGYELVEKKMATRIHAGIKRLGRE